MELAALATKLWNEHDAVRANWMPILLQIWLKDECKCVYCGFDLLGTRGVAYCFSSEDHLLPKSTFPELESRIDNRVLSSRACNVVKGDHDVNRERPLYIPGEGAFIPEDQWQEFRRRARFLCFRKAHNSGANVYQSKGNHSSQSIGFGQRPRANEQRRFVRERSKRLKA